MVAFWAPEEYEPVVVVRCSLAIILPSHVAPTGSNCRLWCSALGGECFGYFARRVFRALNRRGHVPQHLHRFTRSLGKLRFDNVKPWLPCLWHRVVGGLRHAVCIFHEGVVFNFWKQRRPHHWRGCSPLHRGYGTSLIRSCV